MQQNDGPPADGLGATYSYSFDLDAQEEAEAEIHSGLRAGSFRWFIRCGGNAAAGRCRCGTGDFISNGLSGSLCPLLLLSRRAGRY